jgi:hypothetical protein
VIKTINIAFCYNNVVKMLSQPSMGAKQNSRFPKNGEDMDFQIGRIT